jgi:hypothetical protein|tara:strand:- start:107 stop:2308 length:2202 start_codon:yes stop_codon:yes gene_type:complete
MSRISATYDPDDSIRRGTGVGDNRPSLGIWYGDEDPYIDGLYINNESPYTIFRDYLTHEGVSPNRFFNQSHIGTNNSTLLQGWNTANADSLLSDNFFLPDVEAHTRASSPDTPVYQYYDETITDQSIGYQLTQAPSEIQFDFYARDVDGNELLDLSQYYVMDLDWDDNSPVQFRNSPHRLGEIVTHKYEESGFYSITGYMVKRTGSDKQRRNILPRNGRITPTIHPGDPDSNTGEGSVGINEPFKWIGNPGPTDYVIRQIRNELNTAYEIDVDGIEPNQIYTFSMWIGIPRGMTERHFFRSDILAQSEGDYGTGRTNTNQCQEWRESYTGNCYIGNSDWDGGKDGYTGQLADVYTDGTLRWEHRYITRRSPSDSTGRWRFHIGHYAPINQTIYYTGFRLEKGNQQTVHNPMYFKKFRLNIFMNDNPAQLNEFTQLGGPGYLTLPYQHTTPIVGGVSKQSLYYKTVKRLAGSPNELRFLRYSDRLRLQKEAVKLDESLKDLPTIQQFENINENNEPIHRGFLEKRDQDENLLHGMEEFGEGLNNTDLGQVRMFTTGVVSMEDMLGFDPTDTESRTPGQVRYWRNHIPAGYNIGNRTGVTYQDNQLESVDPQDDQRWLNGSYYPVLPKFNIGGRFDDALGNQTYPDVLDSETYDPIEFGSSDAPITKKVIQNQDLILDIDVSEITNGTSTDLSGKNNTGFHINDYKMILDGQDRIQKENLPLATTTNTDVMEGAY